ncbi:MAG: YtxH domain-containing protein [Scytonema sp. RU_4_4]|nr:YtxH domain-containing protein [Scytonema sp. RU_4_4]NJR73417.1 YtxH domain-containing protein [Scytonema sp. CRU_2_7]
MSNNKQPFDQHDENTDRMMEQRKAPEAGVGIGGGLVGAAIGGLLGRRVGGVSGAVIGAVAGALAGKGTAQRVNRTVDSLVDAAKSVAETVNHSVNGVGNAVKDTVEEAKTSVVGAVHAVKDTVEEVKPSVVGTAKNFAETVNHSINDVGIALKNRVNEVKESVIGIEEIAKDTNKEVKPSGTYNNEIDQEPLVTEQLSKSSKEHPLNDNVIPDLSNSPQYENLTSPAVPLPAPPPPISLAPPERRDFLMQELWVKSQENSKLSDEPDIREKAAQGLNYSQQPKSFQEINRKDIESNNIQQKEKKFQHRKQEITQQLNQASIELQTRKIQNIIGILVGVSIITLMSVTLGLSPKQNQLVIKSSASDQNLSPVPETMTDGWIFIGNVNHKASDSALIGKSLTKSSQSTDSPIVPSVGSIVAVTVEPGVTLRDNRPQALNFSHQEQKVVAILKPQEKLKILKLEFLKSSSTTKSPIKVWAKVRRCGNACL